MTDYKEQIDKANSILHMLKSAYQPGTPMPPPGGAPPMDPSQMDPAMMAQMQAQGGGAPPMDPAMMAAQGGGAPPPPGGGGDPAQMEAMLSEVMSAIEQIAGTVQQQAQTIAQLQQQMQEIGSGQQQNTMRTDLLEKALNAPSPHEGIPQQQMM